MRYRATCPACQVRLSRPGFVHDLRSCASCGTRIRSGSKRELWGLLVSAVVGTILCLAGLASGAILFESCFGGLVGAAVMMLCVMTLNWLLWPYVSVYEATPPRDDGHCRTCGYDLRATPDRCPECGTAAGPT